MDLFECKVRYEREVGDGKLKPLTDLYLVEAVTFGDAEARVIEEVKPFVFGGGEVEMKSIRRVNFYEVLPNDQGHFWFIVKIEMTIIDEEKGAEKKVKIRVLLQDVDIEGAHNAAKKMMQDSPTDYSVLDVQKTDIVDVIRL